uniref:Ubiquitin-like domain-containing protein n=1 Tax=Oryzias melastigma TaxID=30732 RepID=A0A3B3DKT5_ORYME
MGKCLGKTYMVEIHGADGVKMQIGLAETPEEMEKITVLQLKEKIDERLAEKGNGGRKVLKLFFKDEMLDEDTLLSEYGIQHKSVIHAETIHYLPPCTGGESDTNTLNHRGTGNERFQKIHMS